MSKTKRMLAAVGRAAAGYRVLRYRRQRPEGRFVFGRGSRHSSGSTTRGADHRGTQAQRDVPPCWPTGFTRNAAALAVLVFPLIGPWSAQASPQSRELTREGFHRAYALDFAESASLFERARKADPSDPAPARAAAAVIWMQILFAQGVATFEAFVGEASEDSVPRPPVDQTLAGRFLTYVNEAIVLSERQVIADPTHIGAQYQLGASTALLALYRATVEGRTWAAFVEGRRAVRTMERVRERQPDHREAALILGMYRYAVSTLSWPKRMLASAAGMPGDREGGIKLLEFAASPPAETATDASLVLTVVYNRERRHAEAMRHLTQLRGRHPQNRLLVLNAAATALVASEPARAADAVTAVLTLGPRFDQPAVLGERAMWFYVRGAARAALCAPGATEDLRRALTSEPRDWIRARTHLELAKLALQAGDEAQAGAHLDAAEQYGRHAGDRVLVEGARRLRH